MVCLTLCAVGSVVSFSVTLSLNQTLRPIQTTTPTNPITCFYNVMGRGEIEQTGSFAVGVVNSDNTGTFDITITSNMAPEVLSFCLVPCFCCVVLFCCRVCVFLLVCSLLLFSVLV